MYPVAKIAATGFSVTQKVCAFPNSKGVSSVVISGVLSRVNRS